MFKTKRYSDGLNSIHDRLQIDSLGSERNYEGFMAFFIDRFIAKLEIFFDCFNPNVCYLRSVQVRVIF